MLKTPNDLISIPAGSIEMRDDRIHKKWTVNLRSFLLGKYPVTQELYREVTGHSPSAFSGDQLPVESVSWKDAATFCNLLSVKMGLLPCYDLSGAAKDWKALPGADGYRLPTEAEWEFACKAGIQAVRYGPLAEIAWYKENAQGSPQPVGLKQPNPWGLYDLLGNVWEWCSDTYDPEVYGTYRIFRGGGWFDEARSCLATNRRRSHPESFQIDDLGFRIAQDLK